MALHVYVDGVEISSGSIGLRVDGDNASGVGPFTESAHLMTYGAGGITFDDPDGNLDIVDYQTIWVEEDACSQPRIFSGYITGHTIRRGPYRHGAGRIWDCDVIDLNLLLQMKLGVEIEAKRPAEDSDARLAFLIGSRMLGDLVFDNGWVDDSVPYPLGEADYRDSYAIDVLTDLVAPRHKNAYVFWDETAAAGEEATLFFDEFTDPGRASTLEISNVLADIVADPTTVGAPDMASEMERDPSQVYSAVRLKSRAATVNANRASTAARIGLAREFLYSNDRIGQLATAEAVAETFLDEHDEPIEIIRCSVLVTSAQVGLIRAGHIINARFTHLPGYETTQLVVITHCTVRLTGNPTKYWLDLEMSNQIGNQTPSVPIGPPVLDTGCAPDDTNVALAGTCTPAGTRVLADPSFANDGNLLSVASRGPEVVGDGASCFIDIDLGSAKILTQVLAREGGNGNLIWFADNDTGQDGTGVRVYWSDNGTGYTIADFTYAWETDPDDTGNFRVRYDITTTTAHRYWRIGNLSTDTGLSFAQQVSIGELEVYECVPNDSTPSPGQVVPWTDADDVTPGATTTTATTPNAWCYVAGTLHVRVAGIDILPSHVDETDPAAGEFTLDWVINDWETVQVSFQGC